MKSNGTYFYQELSVTWTCILFNSWKIIKCLTWRQAFTIHTKKLYQIWGKMYFSAILPVLDGTGEDLSAWCSCLFLTLSSGFLNRIPSHICSRLNFAMFLLRVGLFTLMKMDSLMILTKPCPSLSTMLKSCTNIILPVDDRWWFMWRCLKTFLQPFSKGSCWLPSVICIAFQPTVPVPVNKPLFVGCCDWP